MIVSTSRYAAMEPITGMEGRQIEFVIDQMAQRVFKTSGNDLPIKVDWQEFQAVVYRFESRHVASTFIFLVMKLWQLKR